MRGYVIAVVIGLSIVGCHESPWWASYTADLARQRAAEEAQQRAEEAPHVIREFQGCQIVRFLDEQHWRYYTQCPRQTTTEWSNSYPCGKNCVKDVPQSITTENR